MLWLFSAAAGILLAALWAAVWLEHHLGQVPVPARDPAAGLAGQRGSDRRRLAADHRPRICHSSRLRVRRRCRPGPARHRHPSGKHACVPR
jgi:hypothetical protein